MMKYFAPHVFGFSITRDQGVQELFTGRSSLIVIAGLNRVVVRKTGDGEFEVRGEPGAAILQDVEMATKIAENWASRN